MTYIVQIGDTLQSIARKFQIAVEELIKENNLENKFFLEPGLELIIPEVDLSNNNSFEYYTVKKGDNLYQISKKNNISVDLLSSINGLELNEYIYPEQKILVPKRDVMIYITKDNDTLNSVANNLGIPKENILIYNENLYLLPEQLIAYRIIN